MKVTRVYLPQYNQDEHVDYRSYTDLILQLVKDAVCTANSNWVYDDVSGIQNACTNEPDVSVGCRTLQLVNSSIGRYLRIWFFANTDSMSFVNVDTESTSASKLKLHNNNISIYTSSSTSWHRSVPDSGTNFIFAVSDNSIGTDLGYDLQLICPLFSVKMTSTTGGSATVGATTDSVGYSTCVKGNSLTVLSDTNMVGLLNLIDNNLCASIYAKDMMICTNQNDTATDAVITTIGKGIALGSSRVGVLISNADHNFLFENYEINSAYEENIRLAYSAKDSGLIVTVPYTVYLTPTNYNTSTGKAIVDGICLKGWTNTNYIRLTNNTYVLPSSCVGLKYDNGNWLCLAAGMLCCWDNSDSSPFDPVVNS